MLVDFLVQIEQAVPAKQVLDRVLQLQPQNVRAQRYQATGIEAAIAAAPEVR